MSSTPDFSFIQNSHSKQMLENAYMAISQTETWDFMKKDCECFMFSSNPTIARISAKMEELGYKGHSGASFGLTMRQMQFIAQNNFDLFKLSYQQTN
jgi:hypothetical protein